MARHQIEDMTTSRGIVKFATLFSMDSRWVVAPLLLAFSIIGSQSFGQARFPENPGRDSFYVDLGNIIPEVEGQEINDAALALLQEERIPIIVVTITSLAEFGAAGYTIERYAAALFDEWGIGSEERNYGILLLVSVGDRKARIELGAAWEGSYDRQSKEIMDTLIIPPFKRGAYGEGILGGVRGLDAMARGLALPKPEAPWWALPLMIGLVVLTIGVIISLFKSGRSGWGWALIAFLGIALFFMLRAAAASGGAFGGGSSGGGGASGSW